MKDDKTSQDEIELEQLLNERDQWQSLANYFHKQTIHHLPIASKAHFQGDIQNEKECYREKDKLDLKISKILI